jgi:hypothetical protein
MRTGFWWPTSVSNECRQCDDLGGLWNASVDEFVVGNTRTMMLTCAPGVRKGRFRCEVLRSPPVISFALEAAECGNAPAE